MNRFLQGTATFLCCASLIACNGEETDTIDVSGGDQDTPQLNQLTLAVRDANSNEPLSNVQLTVTGTASYNRTTNAQGLGIIELENGAYQVTAVRQGYEQFQTNVNIANTSPSLTIDLEEAVVVPSPEEMFIFYSGEQDSNYVQYWGDDWGSGAVITDVYDDPNYEKVLSIASGTNWGQGAGIAWGNEQVNAIDARAYTHAKFNLKPSGGFTQVEVNVQGFSIPNSAILYSMTDGSPLNDGWIQFEVPIPTTHDLRWFGLVFGSAEPGSVLLSNVSFITKEEQKSQPNQAAPVPQYENSEVFAIYSDSLEENKWVSVWRDDWWSAPIHTFGEVAGDNYSRYEIVGQGSNGGVVGIQYGIEYGSIDVAQHDTWNIDLYAESGINRIMLQLVSTDGAVTYEINNPPADQWVSYAIPISAMSGDVLNTMQMQMAGIQLWGQSGTALFVDNFYFSGEADEHTLDVTVYDGSGLAIPGATVYIGITGEHDAPYEVTTDNSGVAQLALTQGKYKIKAKADGYGIGQTVRALNNHDTMTMILSELHAAPETAAPVPTVSSDDVISLFSDSLTSDHWISYWSDPWWNPPTQEFVSLSGNNTSKFTITPDGMAGGVTGIQYGIDNPVDASQMTGLRFDFYATPGISKAVFQLLSVSGPVVFEMPGITTGQWIEVMLPFDGQIDRSQMQQLGLALFGTSSDSVYLDNIYFY